MNTICPCGNSIWHRPNSTIQPKLCPACQLKAIQKPKERTKTIFSKKKEDNPIKGKGRKKQAKNGSGLNLADTWFSRYIRVKYSTVHNGEFICKDIITGKPYLAKNIDNGHFYSRYHMVTRFDESNCRPQNRSSNRFSGEADKKKFQINLIREIGEDEFSRITDLYMKSDVKFGSQELKEIAEKYRELTNQLIKEKGGKKWW